MENINSQNKINNSSESHKGKILLFLILFLTLIITLFAVGILYLVLNKSNTDLKENSTNTEDENSIEIGDSQSEKYKYAAIKNDDTISLFTQDGEEVVINLDSRNWQKIKWSESGDLVGVLANIGEEGNQRLDLMVYDFELKEWNKLTDYANSSTGVLNYLWEKTKTLFFNQGVFPDNWLHSLDYNNKSEILKIERIDGEILDKNADETYLLYKIYSGNKLKIYDFQGDEIWDFENLRDEKKNLVTNITSAFFTKDPNKILLIAKDSEGKQKLYKALIGEKEVMDITLNYEFTPVCAVNEDILTGFSFEEEFNLITIINFNIKTREERSIAQKDFSQNVSLDLQSFKCLNKNNILFKTTKDNLPSWYSIVKDSTIDKVTFLNNVKDVDSK